jgi:hypothetical protein
MQAITAITTILLASSVLQVASGQAGTDRPAGVAPEAWIALGPSMGLVLGDPDAAAAKASKVLPPAEPPRTIPGGAGPGAVTPAPTEPLLLTPPVNGYFMVKTGGVWKRLVLSEPLRGPGAVG